MSIDGLKKQHTLYFYAVLFLFSAAGDLPAVVPNSLPAKFILPPVTSSTRHNHFDLRLSTSLLHHSQQTTT